MKVNNVFNIIGAAFTLAAIGMVIARPEIIGITGKAITGIIGEATGPVTARIKTGR